MATYSSELVWACVRNQSSFLRKARWPAVQFSCEPGNLTGKNSFKTSGLANTKTIDIQQVKDSQHLTLTTMVKDVDAVCRKPLKMKRTTTLTKNMSMVAKTISAVAADSFYRPDLKRAALAKASTLKLASKRKKAGIVKGKATRKKWVWKK